MSILNLGGSVVWIDALFANCFPESILMLLPVSLQAIEGFGYGKDLLVKDEFLVDVLSM